MSLHRAAQGHIPQKDKDRFSLGRLGCGGLRAGRQHRGRRKPGSAPCARLGHELPGDHVGPDQHRLAPNAACAYVQAPNGQPGLDGTPQAPLPVIGPDLAAAEADQDLGLPVAVQVGGRCGTHRCWKADLPQHLSLGTEQGQARAVPTAAKEDVGSSPGGRTSHEQHRAAARWVQPLLPDKLPATVQGQQSPVLEGGQEAGLGRPDIQPGQCRHRCPGLVAPQALALRVKCLDVALQRRRQGQVGSGDDGTEGAVQPRLPAWLAVRIQQGEALIPAASQQAALPAFQGDDSVARVVGPDLPPVLIVDGDPASIVAAGYPPLRQQGQGVEGSARPRPPDNGPLPVKGVEAAPQRGGQKGLTPGLREHRPVGQMAVSAVLPGQGEGQGPAVAGLLERRQGGQRRNRRRGTGTGGG